MQKVIVLIFSIVFGNSLYSQINYIPVGFSYQTIVRDTFGQPQADESIILRFALYPSQIAALPDYEEEQSLLSDQFGLINTVIGNGTQTTGTVPFSGIDWKGASYYIEVKIKQGAQFYTIGNREPLLSVPYALVAKDVVNSVPVGTIMPYMGTTAPAGWLLCDGSEISRTNYSSLFGVMGNSCGNGDGSTTFNLPDFRGRFLRGVDGTAGNDPDAAARTAMHSGGNTGNNVGSCQDDSLQQHYHDKGSYNITSSGSHGHIQYSNNSPGGPNYGNQLVQSSNTDQVETFHVSKTSTHIHSNSSFIGNSGISGGAETRPKNAYVNYIIKF